MQSLEKKHITEILKTEKEVISNDNNLKASLTEELPISETFPVTEPNKPYTLDLYQ